MTAPNLITKRPFSAVTIEILEDYLAPIDVDTDYLTMEGTTTKVYKYWDPMLLNLCGIFTDQIYQEKNTGGIIDNLKEETHTTTIDNIETTTLVKSQLAIFTTNEASEDFDVGDVTILLSETVREQLNKGISAGTASCGIGARM